jgi:hypothetical protein
VSTEFDMMINQSKIDPVVLFDTTTRRSWLLPQLSVMLHMAYAYVAEYAINLKAPLPDANAISNRGSAAEIVIKTNRLPRLSNCVTPSDEPGLTLADFMLAISINFGKAKALIPRL